MTARRRRWIVGSVLLLMVLAAAISFVARVPLSSDMLKRRVVASLAASLDSAVDLDGLELTLLPRPRVKGTRLVVRHRGRSDVPPLISIASFSVDADFVGLWRRHVRHVTLEGLDIQIPPDSDDDDSERDRRSTAALPAAGRTVVIDEVTADHASLTILPRRKDKDPRVWVMHELRVGTVGVGKKMAFRSILTNAVPPGRIDTLGSFGPWNSEIPGRTQLDGRFLFEKADLSVFKGISGMLSSRGSFDGTLARIDVKGQTSTPDFTVKVGGHPVGLETKYHAIVDGTNGDTALEKIDASFLQTSIVARGGVYDTKGASGRVVALDVTIDRGRLEDVIRLAVNAPRPPMIGALQLQTRFTLPPGPQDVVEKLQLDGTFSIDGGRFTDPGVQMKINDLSRRASGRLRDAKLASQSIGSHFVGRFVLKNGVLALPKLTFNVPGALVDINGQYGIRRETIAFRGNLVMDAKISQTTTGWKSLLLKAVDPLFRRDGRTVVPITIGGKRSDPSFGLDMRRVFRRD